MTKKELKNEIDYLKKRLDKQNEINKELLKLDLLLDYLGLEIVTEKSIGDKEKFSPDDFLGGLCSFNQLVNDKEDIVIYKDKIVKKNGKTANNKTK